MKRLTVVSLLALSSLIACGGASEPAPAAPTPVASPAEGHDHHAAMPAPVVAFHDSLKPLWHDETAERQAKTCAAIAELDGKADPLATVEVAAAQKDAYAAAVASLDASIAELTAACGGTGDFTAAFTKVHDGFHALTALVGGAEHGAGGHSHADGSPCECPHGKDKEAHEHGAGAGHGAGHHE